MDTKPKTPSDNIIPQNRDFLIDWKTDESAREEFIGQLLADMFYQEEDNALWGTPQFQEALKATYRYCQEFIKERQEQGVIYTMAEMEESAGHFISGYCAALNGKVKIL